MSYLRVLPRDAFNEGNLLKCIGRLTLLIEDRLAPDWTFEYDNGPFEIEQSQDDGSIYVSNIAFTFRGERVRLFRPLNARGSFPVYAVSELAEFAVFDDAGDLVPY